MPIQLIANVIFYKNKFLIGKENDLLIKSSEDLKYFKNITTYSNCGNDDILNLFNSNVLLMGRKTWFSIPLNYRPLKDRVNIVLTNDQSLLKLSKKSIQKFFKTKILEKTKVYFVNMKSFLKIYNATVLNVFVIGGGEVYNMFLKQDITSCLRPETLYITEVKDYFKYNTYDDSKVYNYIEHIPDNYKLISVSSKYTYEKDNRITYRFLKYKLSNQPSQEKIYIDMLKNILNNGNKRIDRTGVGTISIFGTQMRFDISQTIPLLTTRNIPMKVIIEELLWFLRGDTNANILKHKGVNIWNQNTSREFLDGRGLNHYDEGVLGPGYGFQMRFFGGKYSQIFSDTSLADTGKIGGFDQLMYIVNTLKTDPFSRRIMMSYWNPPDFEKTALIPCFPAGTLVLTDNGYKNIENVLITDKLFTHKGNWKNIVNLQQKVYNDDMYEFKLAYNCKKIKATKEHPFFVKDIIRNSAKTIISYSKDPYWCDAKDITKDHIMCLPINKNSIIPNFKISKKLNQYKNQEIVKNIEDKDEWFMLGFYLGDGWINFNQKYFSFCINKKDNENLNIYKRISNVLHLIYKDETDKLIRYNCCNITWFTILKDFDHLAHNKKIPEWVQDAPKHCIEWFIEGYIAADGCKTDKCNGTFTTVSPHIAYGLQRLYAKLGKLLAVRYQKRHPIKIIEGRIVNQKDTYHMILSNKSNKKYVKNIDNDYIYFNVMKINKMKENVTVFNFEVEDDNSYTVQNISVHNCHTNVQFYVDENPIKGEKHLLSCHFYMRSNDFALANNFNVISYTVLTYILALKCDMLPKEIIYSCGDTHVYNNHIEPIKEQLERNPRPFPVLLLNDDIKYKDFKDIVFSDFEVCGYYPYSNIKLSMAV